MAAAYKMIKVQERDKVSLALAEVSSDLTVLADYFIDILLTAFFTQDKALKTGITEQVINALDSGGGADDTLIEVSDVNLKRT